MFLANVLGRTRAYAVRSRGSARHARSRRFRLSLEKLEDRCLPSYTFTQVAEFGPHSFFSQPIMNGTLNDQGTVTFRARLWSGGAGAFTRDMAGNLSIIAITNDVISDMPIGGRINNAGTVSFGADLRDGTQAIFTGRGQELSRITDTGPDTPFSSILPLAADVTNDETVAFRATLKGSGQTGIFTERAGEPPRVLYVTGGRFTALMLQNIQRTGNQVAILATLSSGENGVFLGDGLNTITIATTADTYSAFAAPVANDGGLVAFEANLTGGGQAIVTGDGTQVTTIATTGGPFSDFTGNVSINNDGQVAFAADLAAGGRGLFSTRDGVMDEILGTGDSLFGSTVSSFPDTPFSPRTLNNVGQFGFLANLADGREVWVRADPVPGTVSLAPSEPSPQLVGEPITWTATATSCGLTPVYQFNVGAAGGPLHVVRDFSPGNSFTWAPMQEGTYNVQVTVKNGYIATLTHSDVVSYQVDSRVTGTAAVISPTANALVALYSVPPGPAGTVHVEFSVAGDPPSWRTTNELPSVPGQSTNFLVAGMLPNTTYQMRHVFSDGTTSAPLLFTTGSIPSELTFRTFTVVQPPGPGSDLDQDLIYHALTDPVVTDLQGRIVWYFDPRNSGLLTNSPYIVSTPQPGGTILGFGSDRYALPNSLGLLPRNVLREIDLAGDPVRETNLDVVNAQLRALGHQPIYGFYHEAEHLPDGATVALGITERLFNVNGTPTYYVGTMAVVLDQDFQVTWAWDAFDHLDINRGPILGEIDDASDTPVNVVPNLPAVDWLHNNSVAWSPADGNLILSLRHQDWVIKIDYRNGAGDGHVVWRLGQDGDFTVNSSDPNPWFSHQHDAHYLDDSTIILFDNGNTRRASDPNADSRGQVWRLDEQTMTATLVFNADLGNYSSAVGEAQRLSNGNYSFDSGYQGQPPNLFAQTIEVRPDGSSAYVLEVDGGFEFRTYRLRNLYEGVSDLPGGGPVPARGSRRGSAASPVLGRAELDAGGSNALNAPTGTRASHPDDINAAVALASAAPGKQLATPAVLPESLPDSVSATLAADRIGVPTLHGTGATSDNASATVTGSAVRDVLFGESDLDLPDWGDLTETIVVLPR